MRDGTKFIDKYVDCTRAHLVLDNHRVARADVKSMTIYREPSYTWVERNGLKVDMKQAQEFRNQCPLVHYNDGLCAQPLSVTGECPEHGKVRLLPREELPKEEKAVWQRFPKRRRHVTFKK
jgi:hypothetical protein